MCYLAHSTCAT